MIRVSLFFLLTVAATISSHGQVTQADSTSLSAFRSELINLRADVNNIQLNLGKSEKRFKKGILVSTIGYSVTIAGGLMLGRKQDDLGKVLLVTGGATGITGTFLLVDAFKFLGRASRKKHP
jgi:hypothetical protein